MELKACPFCGKKPESRNEYGHYWLECDCMSTQSTPEEAADEWNTRPVEDALRAEIETLKGKVAALENDVPLQKACEENARLKATIAELEKYISDHSEKEYPK